MQRMDAGELLFVMALESAAKGLICYERAELRHARQHLASSRKAAAKLRVTALVRSLDEVLARIGHADGLSTAHRRQPEPNANGTPAERALHHLKATGQTNQTLALLQQAFASLPAVPRTTEASRRMSRR